MTLLVSEISTSVFQAVKPNSNKRLAAIRPHLYVRNIPAGTIKVQVCTEDGTLIVESSAVNFSTITSSNEYHGYVTFYVSAYLKKDVTYKIYVVCGGGYTFSESAYCGVCNDYDLRKYPVESEIVHPMLAPLDFEFWTYSEK